jgi:aryl-alcohol dehydrogenase-like predicted oxidoreductase
MLDLGLTVIDTADSYGSGDCEILLGKALRNRPHAFRVITKAGYRLSNLPQPFRPLNQFLKKGIQRFGPRQRFEPGYLERCLDDSLLRLRLDRIDAFLLHDPPLDVVANQEMTDLCGKLIKSGKTLLAGVSSSDPGVLEAAISPGAFQVIQTPANIGAASALRALWAKCEARQIHVVGNHVFAPSCLMTSGITHEILMRASSALLPRTSTILCGTRSPDHLRQADEWSRAPLPQAEAEQLAERLKANTSA